MPKRLKLRSKLILALALTVVILGATVPLSNERVRRLGDQLQCKCGCSASITGCNMMNCHFSEPVRESLLTMVTQGMSDDAILAEMVRVYGKDILMKPPAEGFYLLSYAMPFFALAGGLGLLYFVLRRVLKQRAAEPVPEVPVVETPELARYRERIDKDLSDME